MTVSAMRQAAENIISAIHTHPFNLHLANGELPGDKFQFYLMQDALYLAEYARALALTAARLSDNRHMQQFLRFAEDAMMAERELHFSYIPDVCMEQSPACFMYTNYLLKTAALGSIEESVAALLPCFLIYHEVGDRMRQNSSAGNPYQKWIDLYAGELFAASVKKAVAITDELASQASSVLYEKMKQAFFRSVQMEWQFWEGAWHKEMWRR